MGDDDANVGGAGECPGHEWQFEQAVLTAPTQFGLRGLNVVETCKWCGTFRYEPSQLER